MTTHIEYEERNLSAFLGEAAQPSNDHNQNGNYSEGQAVTLHMGNCDLTNADALLAKADQLRHAAQDTVMPSYREKMLKAARELEAQALIIEALGQRSGSGQADQ